MGISLVKMKIKQSKDRQNRISLYTHVVLQKLVGV